MHFRTIPAPSRVDRIRFCSYDHGVGTRKGIFAAALLALLAIAAPARASEPHLQVSGDVENGARPPRIRITLSGTSALTALVDATRTWDWSFGGSVGITRAGRGLGGLLQIGYLSPSAHWEHAIPVDIGGQYRWGNLRRSLFVSGGMSFITFSPRKGMTPRSTLKLTDGWQVVPLVYVDLGGRLMVASHFGFDFKLEARSYWAINILAAKLSLVF